MCEAEGFWKATHQTDRGSDLWGKEEGATAGYQRFQTIGNKLILKKENIFMKYMCIYMYAYMIHA